MFLLSTYVAKQKGMSSYTLFLLNDRLLHAKSISIGSPEANPKRKLSGHVVRQRRLILNYSMAALSKIETSLAVVHPKELYVSSCSVRFGQFFVR
jgi:hypothetical protein